MINENKATQLAIEKLRDEGFEFAQDSAKVLYRERKLSIGTEKKGWVVSFDLNVPETMEPSMVFVHVSDPDGKLYIPPVM
ncbi:hypothetical protein [Vibrio nigripulchritudo]|uniref:hypothetical protein n=1 Tax=Vibrio nigripulchritudo TaxID=28173 RepID=UPI0003B1F9F7|nr:hypothetical protein [Vibrio nigripulchritudo]CCN69731.1 conserved hypothetical protein [Vibrio nigripulchritudo SFn118]